MPSSKHSSFIRQQQQQLQSPISNGSSTTANTSIDSEDPNRRITNIPEAIIEPPSNNVIRRMNSTSSNSSSGGGSDEDFFWENDYSFSALNTTPPIGLHRPTLSTPSLSPPSLNTVTPLPLRRRSSFDVFNSFASTSSLNSSMRRCNSTASTAYSTCSDDASSSAASALWDSPLCEVSPHPLLGTLPSHRNNNSTGNNLHQRMTATTRHAAAAAAASPTSTMNSSPQTPSSNTMMRPLGRNFSNASYKHSSGNYYKSRQSLHSSDLPYHERMRKNLQNSEEHGMQPIIRKQLDKYFEEDTSLSSSCRSSGGGRRRRRSSLIRNRNSLSYCFNSCFRSNEPVRKVLDRKNSDLIIRNTTTATTTNTTIKSRPALSASFMCKFKLHVSMKDILIGLFVFLAAVFGLVVGILILVKGHYKLLSMKAFPDHQRVGVPWTKPPENKGWAIFYNIYVAKDPFLANIDRLIVEEQLEQVGRSYANSAGGLVVNFNTIGEKIDVIWLQSICAIKYNMECRHMHHYETANEAVTVERLHEYCLQQEPEHQHHSVIYMHNKGSFHPTYRGQDRWRRTMTAAVTSELCLNPPDDRCNACGMLFQPLPAPHFPGNIWTAKCSYVQNLLTPTELHEKKIIVDEWIDKEIDQGTLSKDPIFPYEAHYVGRNRYEAEHWLGTHPDLRPCDISVSASKDYWLLEDRSFEEFEFGMAPRQGYQNFDWAWYRYTNKHGGNETLQDSVGRMRDYFLFRGMLFKWYTFYGENDHGDSKGDVSDPNSMDEWKTSDMNYATNRDLPQEYASSEVMLKGGLPDPTSWVWTWFPDGELWKTAVYKYGPMRALEELAIVPDKDGDEQPPPHHGVLESLIQLPTTLFSPFHVPPRMSAISNKASSSEVSDENTEEAVPITAAVESKEERNEEV